MMDMRELLIDIGRFGFYLGKLKKEREIGERVKTMRTLLLKQQETRPWQV